MSHARYTSKTEQLRVEVVPGCDPSAQPVVVWQKSDPELATTTATNGSFAPNEPADWRSEVIDLSAFAGQTVLVRLVSTNDYGNNIFLDNIGIQPYNVVPPVASFVASDTLCQGDTLVFEAAPAGNAAEYNWAFGSGALPLFAFGPGPHEVFYPTAGLKQVRLVVSNPIGSDTAKQLLTALHFPTADFTAATNNLEVSFNNLSQYASAWFWDFGDSATSTDFSPVHTYTDGGTYWVRLFSSNSCKMAADSLPLVLSVGTNTLQQPDNLRLVPNPTGGDFRLEIRGTATERLRFDLLDATGRVVQDGDILVSPGLTVAPFTQLNLPKGRYSLRLRGEQGVRVMAVVVQ